MHRFRLLVTNHLKWHTYQAKEAKGLLHHADFPFKCLTKEAPGNGAQNGPRALPTIDVFLGRRGLFTYFPTFVPESKTDKISKSRFFGRVVDLLSNFYS